MTETADNRQEALCPHFSECSGCHFLHTDYASELSFKEKTLQWELKKLGCENLQIHSYKASNRLAYRNRIQLHYNVKFNQLGFVNPSQKPLVNVKNCLIPIEEIQNEIKKLYENDHWKSLAKSNKGHIEIYWNKLGNSEETGIQVTVDQDYSHGGFSQVNSEMNDKAIELIENEYAQSNIHSVIDLFGGSGNLTKSLRESKTYVVDSTPHKQEIFQDHQEYIQTNLYKSDALNTVKSLINAPIDLLVLDPPRSGLKNLNEWVETFKPQHIYYMSCNTSTLTRDLKEIMEDYEIKQVNLLDFFPSTFHYESLFFLGKKQQKT